MISAVVFDLGNVLIRWSPEPAIARGVGAREARRFLAGFDFDGWNHRQDAGRAFELGEQQAIAQYPQWRDHLLAYRRHFADALVDDIEGSVAILRELHAAGTPVFALTNWSAETFPHARARFDWLRLFDEIVVSGEERIAKPDPAIFRTLADRTGVPLGQMFFVDDSPANVEAARLAGMTAISFTSPDALRAELVELSLVPR